MYKIIKGEVRKVRKGGEWGEGDFFLFFFWLQPVLDKTAGMLHKIHKIKLK